MGNNMKKYMLCFILLIAVTYSSIFAQPNRRPNTGFGRQRAVFTQNFFMPTETTDSILVTSLVRVNYRSLLFKRTNAEMSNLGEYYSIINMDVNYKNSENIIKGRINYTDTIYTHSLNEILINNSFYVRSLTTTLPADDFISQFELMDENRKTIASVKMPDVKGSNLKNSEYSLAPIMAYGIDDNYFAMVLDSALDFRADNLYIFVPFRSDKDIDKIVYSINCTEKNQEFGFTLGELSKQTGSAEIINSGLSFDNQLGDNQLTLINSTKYKLLKIKLNKDMVLPGKYELFYKIDNASSEVLSKFDIVYLSQPMSLRDKKNALLAMQYLMTEQEYSDLKSADDDKFYDSLNKFWIKKDPTPETNYNEAMAEYFRRIDYGMMYYSDPQNPNGSRTERGKIYALYGSPDNIDTKPESDKTIETWNYSKLKMSIVFEVSSAGFYKIIEIIQDGKSQNNQIK